MVDNQSTPGTDFVKKSVEMPIFDAELRNRVAAQSAVISQAPKGGFGGFYRANKIYFWAIFVGLLIIGVLSYLAFRKTPVAAPKNANVAINVSVPATVATGGEAVYTITIKNNDTQTLVNLQLELAYPDGETYENSTPAPQNPSGSLFAVPDLIPGQNAVVFIKAIVNGNINDQKTLDLKLHYHYSNFNSEFIQEQTSTIQLVASNVQLQVQGPATTNNAQLVIYTVNYQNNSTQDIQNAQIQMVYPDGFVFAAATPPPDLGSDTWNISALAKGASGNIQIQGTFSSANPGESKTITANFLILGQDGQYYTQNTSTFTTAISSLPLLITQALQTNSNNSIGVINPGDTLTFNLTYQNNASVAATGVNIEADLNTKVIDPASITAQGGQINNDTILWNAANVPQLASLLPNQQGQLSFSVKVNNPATKDASTNLTLVSSIKIKSNEYSTYFPGNQLTLKVASPSNINTNLTFASGQLPPEVGKATSYQVTLSLVNSSNDFSNGVLTAFLPAGGYISGSVNSAQANNVQFDPSTSKLTWNVGSLPANTGRFSKALTLQFGLSLNPGAGQVGQSPTLLKGITFTANDLFTGQPVNIGANDINTSDVQGTGSYGNGVVQQ